VQRGRKTSPLRGLALAIATALALFAGAATAQAAAPRTPAAGAPKLWTDTSARWIHQDTRTFNVFVAVSDARLHYWLHRAINAWSLRTVLIVREVYEPRLADVLIVDEHAGPYQRVAWTDTCGPCSLTVTHFNLDRLSYTPTATQFPETNPVLWMLSCHEIGHVVGLAHGGGDCLAFSYYRVATWGIGAANARLVNLAYGRTRASLPRMPGVDPAPGSATMAMAASGG
jgi:hypothetical protein